jgi:hypothetical protein
MFGELALADSAEMLATITESLVCNFVEFI